MYVCIYYSMYVCIISLNTHTVGFLYFMYHRVNNCMKYTVLYCTVLHVCMYVCMYVACLLGGGHVVLFPLSLGDHDLPVLAQRIQVGRIHNLDNTIQ